MRYQVHQGIAGPDLPHDLIHLIVELETRDDGGFWGGGRGRCGVQQHDPHRRAPPAARGRPDGAVIRACEDRLQRAELMGNLVERVATQRLTEPYRVRALAREVLATLVDPSVDAERVVGAGIALEDTRRRWSAMRVGDEVELNWPAPRRGRR